MTSKYIYIFLFLIISNTFLLYVLNQQARRGEKVRQQLSSVVGLSNSTSPTERNNVFFLKTHRCGGSAVQNILLRFGLERGLTFVLPSGSNYIGNPEMFNASMIDDIIATKDGKYNIFAHHTRYNSKEVRSVMYDDAVYVTILRQPADQYESLFSYYGFQEIFNLTFEELLKSPKNVYKINRRHEDRIGFNQMSWDLGLDGEDFNSAPKVERFLKKTEEEFDLVMIFDWMEASLVLLADLMKWPLENVMTLKLNARNSDSVYNMTDIEWMWVNELNNVDLRLYTYFLKKFMERIIDYGEKEMRRDIEKLLFLNNNLKLRCILRHCKGKHAPTRVYSLNDESDKQCFFATSDDLAFTKYLRQAQKQKVKVLQRLDVLLHNNTWTSFNN